MVKPTHVLAVDPGECSGWAAWTEDSSLDRDAAERNMMDMLDVAEGWASFWTRSGGRLLLVVESYIVTSQTSRKTQQHWSLEIIGALRWIAHKHGAEFELQTPAQAKRFSSDARLKAEGFWTPTKGGHANDANRHLVLALSRHGLISPRPL